MMEGSKNSLESIEVQDSAKVEAVVDRRPRVISETSEEYKEFRRYQERLSSFDERVFGEGCLYFIGRRRDDFGKTIEQIEKGEIFAFMSKADHVAREKHFCEESVSEAIEEAKSKIKKGLQNKESFNNTSVFFADALSDPEIKVYLESNFKDPKFMPLSEACFLFLRGEIPDSIANEWRDNNLSEALKSLEDEFYQKRLDLSKEMRLAIDNEDFDLADNIKAQRISLIDEYELKIKNERARLIEIFDKNLHALREEYSEKYKDYEMPKDIFERMLKIHVDKFRSISENFESEYSEMMASFRAKIIDDIEKGELPITPGLLDRRISELKVVLWDPMLKQDAVMGDFNPYDARITIRADRTPEERQRTFVHEMYHAISGRILMLEKRGKSLDRPTFIFRKIGLSFKGVKAKHAEVSAPHPSDPEVEFFPVESVVDGEPIFRWLNEAYTEFKAMEHLGLTDSDSYYQFRDLLETMRKEGVDMNLLRDAYYENDDPNMPPEKRKVAWKAFSKNLQEVYPGGPENTELAHKLKGVQILLSIDAESDWLKQTKLLRKWTT